MNDFERDVINNGLRTVAWNNYLGILFAYRDKKLRPIFQEILTDPSVHLYYKCMASTALGECGDNSDFAFLVDRFRSEKNKLLKSYLAVALGKLGNKRQCGNLRKLILCEDDFYVKQALKAALKRLEGRKRFIFKHLPLLDTTGMIKLRFFPDENQDASALSDSNRSETNSGNIPQVQDAIYPHMQYKLSDVLYSLIQYPKQMFGFMTIGWGLHVGEDSGWLFAGMPVHSVMTGRVTLVQHEETWGCLIGIESRLPDGAAVTHYYGHLSCEVCVYPGQIVQTGDMIGEIGPPYSLQNGGYLSHLHLGIEKAPFTQASVKGYADTRDAWYNPVVFIRTLGSRNICADSKKTSLESDDGFYIRRGVDIHELQKPARSEP